jgi:hypothetical protein
MSVVPKKQLEKLEWCESHVAPWTTNAVAIGTTAAEVTAFETKTEAARAAMTAATAAKDAAKNATLALKNAIAALDVAAAGIVKQVRVKAETTNNPNVYVLASIPAPATPSPVGAPGTPSDFAVELFQDGSLEMAWKCVNPVNCTGVVYQIWRRVGGSGEFTYVGGVGEKKFLDTTIPAGSSFFTYKIQAVRSTAVGGWAEFNVNFGTSSAGAMTASVVQTQPKMAA